MANLVTNEIVFHGDEQKVQDILRDIQMDAEGPGSLDFNKVIPMPPSLNIESGTQTINGLQVYRAYIGELAKKPSKDADTAQQLKEQYREQFGQDTFNLGEKAYINLQLYGHTTWYEWSNAHWGTKWNAYEFSGCAERGVVRFCTAWWAPHPVIEKLAERYPEMTLIHRWADEDIGQNCGERIYRTGVLVQQHIPLNGSKEAYELAAEVQGCKLEEYGFTLSEDGSTYEYQEDEGQNEDFLSYLQQN